jgi:hypothetical protein
MKPSILKILWRFNGDITKAYEYCATMARVYPRLAQEYWGYAAAFAEKAASA